MENMGSIWGLGSIGSMGSMGIGNQGIWSMGGAWRPLIRQQAAIIDDRWSISKSKLATIQRRPILSQRARLEEEAYLMEGMRDWDLRIPYQTAWIPDETWTRGGWTRVDGLTQVIMSKDVDCDSLLATRDSLLRDTLWTRYKVLAPPTGLSIIFFRVFSSTMHTMWYD